MWGREDYGSGGWGLNDLDLGVGGSHNGGLGSSNGVSLALEVWGQAEGGGLLDSSGAYRYQNILDTTRCDGLSVVSADQDLAVNGSQHQCERDELRG